jgi:primary-amine oxidase
MLLIVAAVGAGLGIPRSAESVPQPAAATVTDKSLGHCVGKNSLSVRLTKGSRWSLCWEIDQGVGLRVTNVQYAPPNGHPIPVLREAALAQIHVPYDNGRLDQQDLPGFGILTAGLRSRDCLRGARFPRGSGKKVLCVMIEANELRYSWSDYDFGSGNHTLWGSCATIFTVTPVDWYTYVTRWRLCDDGSIRADVGAGGTLAPRHHGDGRHGSPLGRGRTRFGVAHYHNVFWRLEFALGSSGITVSQYDVRAEGRKRGGTLRALDSETASKSRGSRRWRIFGNAVRNADAHSMGYEIELSNPDPYRNVPDRAFTDNDFYVTEHRSCEVLASVNLAGDCAISVDRYVNGETLVRPVVWLQTSFHHVPRDEDEPIMNEHWQGFSLIGRGLTATNPLARSDERD